jgi:hypothetical protein
MTTALLAVLSLLVGAWHIAVLAILWWLFVGAVKDDHQLRFSLAVTLLVGVAWTALLFSGMAKVTP